VVSGHPRLHTTISPPLKHLVAQTFWICIVILRTTLSSWRATDHMATSGEIRFPRCLSGKQQRSLCVRKKSYIRWNVFHDVWQPIRPMSLQTAHTAFHEDMDATALQAYPYLMSPNPVYLTSGPFAPFGLAARVEEQRWPLAASPAILFGQAGTMSANVSLSSPSCSPPTTTMAASQLSEIASSPEPRAAAAEPQAKKRSRTAHACEKCRLRKAKVREVFSI